MEYGCCRALGTKIFLPFQSGPPVDMAGIFGIATATKMKVFPLALEQGTFTSTYLKENYYKPHHHFGKSDRIILSRASSDRRMRGDEPPTAITCGCVVIFSGKAHAIAPLSWMKRS